jgi:hypothetical protein
VSAHRSLFNIVSLQVVNRATSIVSLISRLYTNINAAAYNDLAIVNDYVDGLNDVYSDAVDFTVDMLSAQLTTVIEAIGVFVSIASRTNATGETPAGEELDLINQLMVGKQSCFNTYS